MESQVLTLQETNEDTLVDLVNDTQRQVILGSLTLEGPRAEHVCSTCVCECYCKCE